jgi:hypothetical protein
LSSVFSIKAVCALAIVPICAMPSQSHTLWFYKPSNISRSVQMNS